MLIPLKDNNPSRSYPVVNITLLFANVVVFLYQLALPPMTRSYSYCPTPPSPPASPPFWAAT